MNNQVFVGRQDSHLNGSHEFEWLLRHARDLGITRIADITGLDRLGVFCHSAIVVGGVDIISTYSGKGLSIAESMISAVMEAVERNLTCWDWSRVTVACCRELESRRVSFIHPRDFTEPLSPAFSDETSIGWVAAEELYSGSVVMVPAALAFSGYSPPEAPPSPFTCVTSNGLAAGLSVEQALVHGIREVMERDVVSCCELLGFGLDAGYIEGLAKMFGVQLAGSLHKFQCRTDVGFRVRHSTLPEKAKQIVNRLEALGARVAVRALPNHYGLPVFGACAVEELSDSNWLKSAGYGLHGDAEKALLSALTEVAQGRATSLHGSREDYHDNHLKSRGINEPRSDWLLDQNGDEFDFGFCVQSMQRDISSHSLSFYVSRLRDAGFGNALAVKFTSGIVPAVRLLVPGVETVHPTQGNSRLGFRGLRLENRDEQLTSLYCCAAA